MKSSGTKVLQVLGGGAWGGGSVVVLAITRALIARGAEVTVIALDDETATHFRAAGAKAVRAPLWFRPINPLDIVPFLFLWLLCLRNKYDLVATHTSKGGVIGRIAARLAGVPTIVHHVHGFAFHQFTAPRTLKLFVALERFAARFCDFIIAVGEQHRQTTINFGIKTPDEIATVLNGIDLEKFQGVDREASRRSLGFGRNEQIIGSIGRLAPQKGFEYAIRAMKLVLAENPNARLVLAGDGPLEAELREEARRNGVEERVTFLGFRRDVPELLAAFDIFVHPSLWEGLSISLMEAMAAGKPIVASDIWGNKEMIVTGHNGILVPPADPEALAAALNRTLAGAPLAKSMADQAKFDAFARFTEDRMVAENVAAYDRAVALGSECRSLPLTGRA